LFGQSFSFAATCDCGDPSAWKPGKTIGCTHHPPGPQPEIRPPKYLTSDSRIPDFLITSIKDTIILCLEYIITTLVHSPLPSTFPVIPKDMEAMTSSDDDQTGEPPERRGKGPWSVTLWSDEKHVMKEVTRQVRDSLGIPWGEAEVIAQQADELVRQSACAS
jgi:E3 ubiquitin-protein ligase UBR1